MSKSQPLVVTMQIQVPWKVWNQNNQILNSNIGNTSEISVWRTNLLKETNNVEQKFRKIALLKNIVCHLVAVRFFSCGEEDNASKLPCYWFELIRIGIRAYGPKFVNFDIRKSPQYTYYVFFSQDRNLEIFDLRPIF